MSGLEAGERPLLEVRHLQRVYSVSGGAVEAIRDVHFSLPRGQLLCVVGPSGAGKTTLLRCISGLLEPTSGEVLLDGNVVSGPPPQLAMVFQEYGRSLFPWMRVSQNVELPLKAKGVAAAERRRLVAESLDAVGLSAAHSAYPWQLSGGMQQRVAIARAVAYEPEVLLMDEPFASVDAQTRADLEDLVRSIWSRLGVTIVFVTHDIDEAVYLGERVIILSASPTEIMANVDVPLGRNRDQVGTRASALFGDLRAQIYGMIQAAKKGQRAAIVDNEPQRSATPPEDEPDEPIGGVGTRVGSSVEGPHA